MSLFADRINNFAVRIERAPRREHSVLALYVQRRPMMMQQEPEPAAWTAKAAECETNCAHHRPVRLSWAQLRKRMFNLDMEHWPKCGGQLKIVAPFLEQPAVEKIPAQKRLQARALPCSPARCQARQAG